MQMNLTAELDVIPIISKKRVKIPMNEMTERGSSSESEIFHCILIRLSKVYSRGIQMSPKLVDLKNKDTRFPISTLSNVA
jgi:hypothetical protein